MDIKLVEYKEECYIAPTIYSAKDNENNLYSFYFRYGDMYITNETKNEVLFSGTPRKRKGIYSSCSWDEFLDQARYVGFEFDDSNAILTY